MENKFSTLIVGQHVILKKAEIQDAFFIYQLRTSNAGRFLRQPLNYNLESQENWMRNRPSNEINYIIYDKYSSEKVGTIGIYDVNFLDRIANVGRLILVEKFLNKSNPYGLEALFLTYNFVFNNLDFRKITGDILSKNIDMVKFQLFLGMEQEGFLKEHVKIQNKFEDLHIMSMFKNKFTSVYAKRTLFLLKSFSKI